jgi:hypothetical protein
MDDARGRFVDPNGTALVAQRRESFSLSLAAGLVGRPLETDLSSPVGRAKFTADKTALVKQIEESGDTLGVSRGDILDVISEDVSKLLADINAAADPGCAPAFHSLLIMIDDLHIYEGLASELVTAIVDTGLAGQRGRAATVFTYSTRAGRGAELLGLIKARNAIQRLTLQPFQEPTESRLAYAQMMLSREKPLAPSSLFEKRDHVEKMFGRMHKRILGVPSFFDLAEDIIGLSKDFDVLVDADDQAIIGGV